MFISIFIIYFLPRWIIIYFLLFSFKFINIYIISFLSGYIWIYFSENTVIFKLFVNFYQIILYLEYMMFSYLPYFHHYIPFTSRIKFRFNSSAILGQLSFSLAKPLTNLYAYDFKNIICTFFIWCIFVSIFQTF